MTAAERLAQAHHRAERGTSCWLAGECDKPNSYAYDRDIGAELKTAFAQRNPSPESTLWITVQGRVVFIEGCVANEHVGPALEALAKEIPAVQQVVVLVYADLSARAPYELRSAP